jgi:ubiquitin carboxyl-terminal hydrolase L5
LFSPEPFVSEEKRSSSSSDDDAFHFITYVPINGNIYELDGLKPGPILLEACTDDDWLDKAAVHIQARIQRYSQSEIRFNLMVYFNLYIFNELTLLRCFCQAIIQNRQEHLNERLLSLEKQRQAVQSKLTNPLSESAGTGSSIPNISKSILFVSHHLT